MRTNNRVALLAAAGLSTLALLSSATPASAATASASASASKSTSGGTVTAQDTITFSCAKPKGKKLSVRWENHSALPRNYVRVYFNSHCKEDRYLKLYWQSSISLNFVGTDCLVIHHGVKGNKKKYWRWSRVYQVTSPGICGPQT